MGLHGITMVEAHQMNIALSTIKDQEVRSHMWEKYGAWYMHTKNPEFFATTHLVQAPPPTVLSLMEACSTDRVGADFFGTLHPLAPSDVYTSSVLRRKEELEEAKLRATRAERRRVEERAMYAERVDAIRHEQAFIVMEAAKLALRGFRALLHR